MQSTVWDLFEWQVRPHSRTIRLPLVVSSCSFRRRHTRGPSLTLPSASYLRCEVHVAHAPFLLVQPELEEATVVPLAVMPFGEVGRTFVMLSRGEGSLALGKLACTLRFTIKEIDPSTGEKAILPSYAPCLLPGTL